MKAQDNLSGANGIRALACLMVIAHHAIQRLSPEILSSSWWDLRNFILQWNVGVSGFFVLSGFLLSMPFWSAFRDQKTMPDLKEFALRRLARIAPAYYVALIACFLMQGEAPDALLRLFSGLSFTTGFHWKTWFPSEINGPLWSISLEVFCYGLLPLGMFGMFKLGSKKSLPYGLGTWVGLLAIVLMLNQLILFSCQTGEEGKGWEYGLQGGAKYWLPNYNPIGFFAHYALGVLAAGSLIWLRTQRFFGNWKQSGLFDLTALGGFILLFAWLWHAREAGDFSSSFQEQPYFYPLAPLCFAGMLCFLAASRKLGEWVDNIAMRFVAQISFGLYLWHYAVMEIMLRRFAPDYHYAGVANLGRFAGLTLTALGISLALAMLSWYFVEKPALNLLKRHLHRKKTFKEIPSLEQT